MSKIGNNPIQVPAGVDVTIEASTVKVVGPKGEIVVSVPPKITLEKDGDVLNVKRGNESNRVKSLHGLIRSLVYNAVTGVVSPWKKNLEVVGTGYRVKPQGVDLLFEVGYSHNVIFKKPENIEFKVEGTNKVQVLGIDKQHVGEVAFKIRSIRKPDAYKGKGIRYEGEYLKLKPGKKAKTG